MRTFLLYLLVPLLMQIKASAQQPAVQRDPKVLAATYAALGKKGFEFDDPAYMLEKYQKAIALAPDETEYLWYAGVAAFKLGKYDLTIKYNKKCLELDSSLTNAYRNWGMALYKTARYKEALEKMDIAVAKRPAALNYFYRGAIKDSLKDYKGAFDDYCSSLRLDSMNADVWLGRAILRLRATKETSLIAAVDDLNTAISLEPRSTLAHYYRAMALTRTGEFSQQISKDLLLASWLGLNIDKKIMSQYGMSADFSMELVSIQRISTNPLSSHWSAGDLNVQLKTRITIKEDTIRIGLKQPVELKLGNCLKSYNEADKTITQFSIINCKNGQKGRLRVTSSRYLSKGVFLFAISFGEHPVEYLEYTVNNDNPE